MEISHNLLEISLSPVPASLHYIHTSLYTSGLTVSTKSLSPFSVILSTPHLPSSICEISLCIFILHRITRRANFESSFGRCAELQRAIEIAMLRTATRVERIVTMERMDGRDNGAAFQFLQYLLPTIFLTIVKSVDIRVGFRPNSYGGWKQFFILHAGCSSKSRNIGC